MIKEELRSGQVLEVVDKAFQYTPVGTLVVYEDLTEENCLLVNEEHAYLSDIDQVKKHCVIANKAVDFDHRQVIINDRKRWFINQLNQLKNLCKQ